MVGMGNSLEAVYELMEGAYDLHVHPGPCVFPRKQNDFAIMQAASDRKMAGIMLKSHYEYTGLRAQLINESGKFTAKAFGGMALNWPVGGLNPLAVAYALKTGVKIIWMPTLDADNSVKRLTMGPGKVYKHPGISVVDEKGKLKDVVYEIMDLVKESGSCYLATGHVSPEEAILLCREGRKRNVPMILTHPELTITSVPAAIQKELADAGTLIEKNWINIPQGCVTETEMAEHIRIVGPSRVYIATDRGQKSGLPPVEDYARFIDLLLRSGFSKAEIRLMAHTVPEKIVG